MRPKVSVVLPAYNAERTIERALASVRGQNYPSMELLVVDDASTDLTCRTVERSSTGDVRLFRHDTNRGAAAARNTALFVARGEYVAFLDADDLWLPGKLASQVEQLNRNPRMSLVTCDCLILDESGLPRKRTHAQHRPVSGANAWKALLAANFIPTPTVLARRDALLAAGGFDSALPVAEDLDLWIRMGVAGEIGVLPEVFVHVYERPGSLMNQYAGLEEQVLFSILDRHFAEQRARLTAGEIRFIRGQRFFKVGAKHFDHKQYGASCRPFWRSALSGYRPIRSLVNIARASAMSLSDEGTTTAVQPDEH